MPERDFHLYLADILDSGIAIMEFVKGLSFEEFCNDRKTHSAVIREFEIIGEAANHLTSHFKKLYSEIPWQEIVGLRNILIHEYFGIDTKIVWDIINNDIVSLKLQIKEIIEQI